MIYKTYLVSGFKNGQPASQTYQALNEIAAMNSATMDGFSQINIREV